MKYHWPDHIIAISNTIAAQLAPLGLPADKLSVVHSGIDPNRFDVPAMSRTELGVPDDSVVLGNVAALVAHKDQATLIAAMAEVVRAVPNAHLVVAGEGPLRPALEAQIQTLHLQRHVRLLGYHDDVPGLLHALDLFVMSSREEGLGTSVLDAMACGVPVVATAGGGIPEMVQHEVTGLLVPVGDATALAAAILRVLNDHALRSRLVHQADALLQARFTADRMVEGNLAVYERLLA